MNDDLLIPWDRFVMWRSLKPGMRLRYAENQHTVTLSRRKGDNTGWWLLPGEGGLADEVLLDGTWVLAPSSGSYPPLPATDGGAS